MSAKPDSAANAFYPVRKAIAEGKPLSQIMDDIQYYNGTGQYNLQFLPEDQEALNKLIKQHELANQPKAPTPKWKKNAAGVANFVLPTAAGMAVFAGTRNPGWAAGARAGVLSALTQGGVRGVTDVGNEALFGAKPKTMGERVGAMGVEAGGALGTGWAADLATAGLRRMGLASWNKGLGLSSAAAAKFKDLHIPTLVRRAGYAFNRAGARQAFNDRGIPIEERNRILREFMQGNPNVRINSGELGDAYIRRGQRLHNSKYWQEDMKDPVLRAAARAENIIQQRALANEALADATGRPPVLPKKPPKLRPGQKPKKPTASSTTLPRGHQAEFTIAEGDIIRREAGKRGSAVWQARQEMKGRPSGNADEWVGHKEIMDDVIERKTGQGPRLRELDADMQRRLAIARAMRPMLGDGGPKLPYLPIRLPREAYRRIGNFFDSEGMQNFGQFAPRALTGALYSEVNKPQWEDDEEDY